MIKVMRAAGDASPLVIGVVAAALTVALPGSGGARPVTGFVSAPTMAARDPGLISGRPVRLEDLQRDSGRRDERHLRKREWHRHWDNRLDFWDPSHGRKVFVG